MIYEAPQQLTTSGERKSDWLPDELPNQKDLFVSMCNWIAPGSVIVIKFVSVLQIVNQFNMIILLSLKVVS